MREQSSQSRQSLQSQRDTAALPRLPAETGPITCAVCARRLGKTAPHILLGWPDHISADRVLCLRCMRSTRELHQRFHPDCPVSWHDLHDHPTCSATRAAAAWLLADRTTVEAGR